MADKIIFTNQQQEEIIDMYLNKRFTINKICKIFSCSYSVILRVLRENNIKRIKDNRIYSVNDNYFDNIDTEKKAYYFGLLYADGANYENIGHIKLDLIQEDLCLLQQFKKDIKYTGEILLYETKKFKTNNKEYSCKPYARLNINSKRISEQLAQKGCVANKSCIAKFPTSDIISDELLVHFIRGYMDGNGSISYWIDNPNTKHKKFSLSFCGTENIIKKIGNILDSRFGCHTTYSDRTPESDNNNIQSCISGNKLIKNILNWIYQDATVYMKRKHDKYNILIAECDRVDSNTNLYGNAYPRKIVINITNNTIFKSLNAAARYESVSTSTMYKYCHNKTKYMYYDDYLLTK